MVGLGLMVEQVEQVEEAEEVGVGRVRQWGRGLTATPSSSCSR